MQKLITANCLNSMLNFQLVDSSLDPKTLIGNTFLYGAFDILIQVFLTVGEAYLLVNR